MLILPKTDDGIWVSLLLELPITQGTEWVGILLQNHLYDLSHKAWQTNNQTNKQKKEAEENPGQHSVFQASLACHYKSTNVLISSWRRLTLEMFTIYFAVYTVLF